MQNPDTTFLRDLARALGNSAPSKAQLEKATEMLADAERSASGLHYRSEGSFVLPENEGADQPIAADGLYRCVACGLGEMFVRVHVDGFDLCQTCARDAELDTDTDNSAAEAHEEHHDDRAS